MNSVVYIVDDDSPAQQAIAALVQSMNLPVESFDSAEAFLAAYQGEPGCVVADYRLGGQNGIELQEQLKTQGYTIPVILVTAHARTSLVVRAMQNGAVTVLDKPYQDDDLWHAIRDGLARDQSQRSASSLRRQQLAKFDTLSSKEGDVLELLVVGMANKAMAAELDVSLRTIENRRRKLLTKLGVSSIAELMLLVLSLRQERPELLRRVDLSCFATSPNGAPITTSQLGNERSA